MFQEKSNVSIGGSKFAETLMILYTTVNIIKLLEQTEGYEEDAMTKEILDITLNELFRTVLRLDNGLWN